jgi:hypothetical protein
MAERKVVKLTDGTEADFAIGTSLADIDKKLATEGLKRDSSVKPFAERGVVDSTMAKINLPIVQGASALLGLPGAVAEGLQTGAEKISQAGLNPFAAFYGALGEKRTPEQAAAGRPVISAPTPASITRAVGENIPLQRAESIPGQLAQTTIRNIASAPVAGAVVPSMLSAAGEEAVAFPFRGTPLEPAARAVGAIGAPIAALPFAVKSPMERMYTESTQRMTPEQVQAASQLQRQSFQAGMPVTSFEAMQQAAGGRTTLPALQRQVEGMPASAPQMAEFMAERGAATQRTLQEQFPQTTRAQLGTEMQVAAQAEIRALNKQLVEEAGPAFKAVKAKKIPMSWMTNLERESAVIAEAGKAVDNIPAYQDLLKGFPNNSIARIESMRQYLADKYDNLAVAAQGKVTGEMKAYQTALENLKNKADIQVPAYAAARADYQKARERIVGPLTETPIPNIAATSEVPKQFGELFATKAAEINLTPNKVKNAVRALAKTDPSLPKEFLNQYMRSSLENVQRAATTQAGTVGPRFADTIARNTTQRANLEAAFVEIYGEKGKEAAKGLNNMMRILDAQGRRLPAGSPTAEKGMLAEASVGTVGQTLKQPLSAIGNMYQSVFFSRDYQKMAKAMTSPDGVMALENIAKAGKDRKKIGLAFTELQQIIKAAEAEESANVAQ